jgi:hypothetical protein
MQLCIDRRTPSPCTCLSAMAIKMHILALRKAGVRGNDNVLVHVTLYYK